MAPRTGAWLLKALLSICLVVSVQTVSALACVGQHVRVFPTCEINEPRADERTTVIYANRGTSLSSVTLGSDIIVTEVVDIEVEPADKPHYIVLSSGTPIIWRFTGRIDTVSRIVVFGSQYNGATRAGIVGVPHDRIHFARTDLDQLKEVKLHSCLSLYFACELSAYFDIPKADRMKLAGPIPEHRHPVDQFVEHIRAGVIRIPHDGTLETDARGQFGYAGRHEPYMGTAYYEASQVHEGGVVVIDPTIVVSPGKVAPYKTLPGAAGLRELVKSGALVTADSPEFKRIYDTWNEVLSAPFRSHLDPNFLFSYKVDYLIAKPMHLPAALDKTSFLVADNVETPELAGGWTCLFFADQRELVLDPKKQSDPRCDRGFHFALPDSQRSLVTMRQALERQKRVSAKEREACKQAQIDQNAYLAGVALSEGPAWRPGAVDASRRRVDVHVKRPGNVALYLEMWGGRIDWHIIPSGVTQISSILLGSLPQRDGLRDKVYGVDSAVPVASIFALGNPCFHFNPSRYGHLGGPAALALNEGLKVLAGRGLDHLLRGMNDGTWPPVSVDPEAPRATFEIE